jgi:hypothetical protein
MKHPSEYTITQYKKLHGNQWKITERKISMVRNPQKECHFFMVRTYSKKVDGVWIEKMGFRFDYPATNKAWSGLLYSGRTLPAVVTNLEGSVSA